MSTTSAKRDRARWAGGVCVAALMLPAGLALAQTAPSTAGASAPGGATQLEEITVTAQKQSENVQKVPISITAVTGATVAAAHTANLEALQGAVPDVQIGHFSNNPASAVFNIRGMGVIEADPYAGSTVGVVVDGVPQFFNMISLPVIYDLDRIEVLRGPQGTLFGANTIGGVINVLTSQPTGEFGGTASLTYGNYHRLDGAATINFPIIEDKLAGKLAFYHDGVDGYVTNVVNGAKMGNQDWTSLRAYLKWTPTPNFDATLQGGYSGARGGGPIVVNGSVPGEVEYVPAGTILPGDAMGQYASPCPPNGGHCSAPGTYYGANSSVPDSENIDIYSTILTANWKTSIGKLTSITGYESFTDDNWTDQDGTVEFLDDTHRYTKGWQFSEELRDSFSPLPGVKVLVGGFFQDDHYFQFQNFRVNFASVRQYNTQDQDNRSASLFVQTYWDITSKLRLQVGVRGTTEHTRMTASLLDYLYGGTVQFTGGTLLPSTPDGPSIPPETGAKTWNNLGGKVGLDYQWTPNLMTYAYYARGFKSGGFVGRIGIPSDLGPYNPEYVDTFEVGAKTDWFDRRLRADIALFYNDYRDLQVAEIYFVGAVQGNSILNAATARTQGAEFELTARPVQGLTLNASVAYLDARYTRFLWPNPNNGGALQSLAGYPLNDAPAWTAAGGVSYIMPLGPGRTTLGASTRFTGSKYEEAINDTGRSYVQPTLYFDGTLAWQPTEDSHWSIEAWARNISDRHYIASVYDAPGTLGLVNYAPPRMYGATFKVRW